MTEEKLNVDDSKKTCFVVMPISDHPDYPKGHFKRVYEYIIKPACEAEGLTPIRADNVKLTNLIALDIIKKIIECDMVICDLSSSNPNVLYEVGIRQAFNLPVTFIKDIRTPRIFDIQGFRDVVYDESLRIDTVDEAIAEISETLRNTFADKDVVNSLVGMLGIQPAKVSNKEISSDTELILNALNGIKMQQANVGNRSSHGTVFMEQQSFPLPEDAVKITPENVNELNRGDKVFSRTRGFGMVVANDKSSDRISVSFHGVNKTYPKIRPVIYRVGSN